MNSFMYDHLYAKRLINTHDLNLQVVDNAGSKERDKTYAEVDVVSEYDDKITVQYAILDKNCKEYGGTARSTK